MTIVSVCAHWGCGLNCWFGLPRNEIVRNEDISSTLRAYSTEPTAYNHLVWKIPCGHLFGVHLGPNIKPSKG